MARMPFSRKAKYGLAITALLGTMAGMGSTIAYFSSQQTTNANTLQTGTLQAAITQNTPLSVTNWQPGEEKFLDFTVVNTGQLPFYARAVLNIAWSDASLPSDVIERVGAERWIGGDWHVVSTTVEPATLPLLLSTDGTEGTLLSLLPTKQEKFRMKIRLSPDAANEYQGKTLTGAVTVTAKQTTAGTPWPTE